MFTRIARRLVLLAVFQAAAQILAGRDAGPRIRLARRRGSQRDGLASLLRGAGHALSHSTALAFALDAAAGPAHRELERGVAELRRARRRPRSRTRRAEALAAAGAGGLIVWSLDQRARRRARATDLHPVTHAPDETPTL